MTKYLNLAIRLHILPRKHKERKTVNSNRFVINGLFLKVCIWDKIGS